MPAAHILWIDLRCYQEAPGLVADLPNMYTVTRAACAEAVSDAIRVAHPTVVCVEFDYPDEVRLAVVERVRRQFAELPLLMFTEYHSEALAVRVFRWGVWDYRVKPISGTILARSIRFAVETAAPRDQRHRPERMPTELAAPSGHLVGPVATTIKTAAAVAYIAEHFRDRITRKAMAALCHLSLSEFTRTFRREHELTFERHLVEIRITKARELLIGTQLTVTQVALAVGFNDSSYFARAFRRLAGMTASEWRQRLRAGH